MKGCQTEQAFSNSSQREFKGIFLICSQLLKIKIVKKNCAKFEEKLGKNFGKKMYTDCVKIGENIVD